MRGLDLGTCLAIGSTVTLTSVAQIVLKIGMMNPHPQSALGTGSAWQFARAVLLEPWLVVGLVLYGVAAMTWMLVLGRVQLSTAYPFVGASFVLVALLSWLCLDEAFQPLRLVGSLLVMAGVILVVRSPVA